MSLAVMARLKERPGVTAVVLATREGALLDSTLGAESEEAKKLALHFSRVLSATEAAYAAMGLAELPEVLSFVSGTTEHVVTVGPAAHAAGVFFVSTRRNE